jgi:hypothetical protein
MEPQLAHFAAVAEELYFSRRSDRERPCAVRGVTDLTVADHRRVPDRILAPNRLAWEDSREPEVGEYAEVAEPGHRGDAVAF